MLLIFVTLILNSCSLFEEEPEVLLSSIDGAAYYETKHGAMNARKASLFILEGKEDSVSFEIKLDVLDSIESIDSLWRPRYLIALNLILDDVYVNDSTYVESKVFSFFIHFPNELISLLNNEGFDHIEGWMTVLSRGLKLATSPSDITINSVANAAISNCRDCDKAKQKLIVDFITELSKYEEV